MGKDDGGSVSVQRLLDDFPGVNGRVVDRATEEFVEGQDPVAIIEKQAAEDLMGTVTQTGEQKMRAVGWTGDIFSGSQFFFQKATAALPCGTENSGFAGPDTAGYLQFAAVCIENTSNAAETAQ